MTEYLREQFVDYGTIHKLYMLILSKHIIAEHTKKNLSDNRHIKNFCEEARHYIFIPGFNETFYISYDVASWFHPDGAYIKIEKIIIYDTFLEYETERMTNLHSGRQADIPNIN